MEIKKKSGFSRFFRRYGYYAFVGMLILAVGLTLALTLPGEVNNNNIDDPDEDVPTGTLPIVFSLPMAGANLGMNFSDTELEWNQTMGEWSAHLAIDFVAGESNLVYSVADGTVTEIVSTYDFGTCMTIEHKDGYKSVYKSLNSSVKVKVGDDVLMNQEIGAASDSAGNESLEGPHLHFELYKDGLKVNPGLYLDLENK